MASVHGLQHVERFGSANLTDDDTVGTHPERIAYQIALRDLATRGFSRAVSS